MRREESCGGKASANLARVKPQANRVVNRLFGCFRRRGIGAAPLTIPLFLLTALESMSIAQAGGFKCPMKGTPAIRQGDSVAASGGRFDSSRAGGKKHGALELNGILGDPVFASLAGKVAVADPAWGNRGEPCLSITDLEPIRSTVTLLCLGDEGKDVKTGDKIGSVGYTGNAQELGKLWACHHTCISL